MKVELVPSTVGQPGPQQFCVSVLVNDSVAIDAGTLGLLLPLTRQRQIQHVFLSHSHADHTASLPLFLDNVYSPGPDCPTVYAGQQTHDCLQNDIFNDRVWPNFIQLSQEETPFLKQTTMQSETPIALDSVIVTPVSLDHPVPTFGFVTESNQTPSSPPAAVAFVSDTRPTDAIWKTINSTPNIKAVFVECSFPNSHEWLAEKAGHLCPALLAAELDKLKVDVRVFAFHIKPAWYDTTVAEIHTLNREITIAEPGVPYQF